MSARLHFASGTTAAALAVEGAAGTFQELQYADALGNPDQWVRLTTMVLGSGPYLYTDTALPLGGKRFYRVAAPSRWAWIARVVR